MNSDQKVFLCVWGNGEYDDNYKPVTFEFFSNDNGYDTEDRFNINRIDVMETYNLSIGHIVIRIK